MILRRFQSKPELWVFGFLPISKKSPSAPTTPYGECPLLKKYVGDQRPPMATAYTVYTQCTQSIYRKIRINPNSNVSTHPLHRGILQPSS